MEPLRIILLLFFAFSELSYVEPIKVELGTNKSKSLEIVNSTLCNKEKCIMKCCPIGKYFTIVKVKNKGSVRTCKSFDNTTTDFFTLAKDVFLHFPEISKLNFTLKAGIFATNKSFIINSVGLASSDRFNVYLTEYPEVFLELPNAYQRWTRIPNDRFCWEHKMSKTKEGVRLTPGIWAVFPEDPDEPSRTSTTLFTTAMLVSCFFLLVVLVVYALLPELRNLCGQILMAYVASLFVAFLLLVVIRIEQHEDMTCRVLTFLIYYFFMASFSWMHVMSYDIWWTFRGYAKARPIHRRGENFKFLMYCLYAFGLPLALTILLIVLNEIDMSHMPWVITPKIPINGCFIEGGERLLYLYTPMLILILCNWVFYIMTAFNVWRLSRGTAVLDSAAAGTPQAHRTHYQRFMVYLKLSVVMGLNWVLEVVSSMNPGYSVWFISDLYNILIGLTIFLIFVCKKKIFRKLMKRYLRCKNEWRPGQKDSMKSTTTSDSHSSQETQSLQICANPKGPGYQMKPV